MSTNGHDPMTQKMVEVLERIEGELKELRGEVHAFKEQVHEDLGELRAGLTTVKNELSGLRRDTMRMTKVEAVVFKPTGT